MDRPPATPPRRRWWHRYAVIEIQPTMRVRVISWHRTMSAATDACLDITVDALHSISDSPREDSGSTWTVRHASLVPDLLS